MPIGIFDSYRMSQIQKVLISFLFSSRKRNLNAKIVRKSFLLKSILEDTISTAMLFVSFHFKTKLFEVVQPLPINSFPNSDQPPGENV